ncbi:NERD domain-containing protein [Neisseria weixii]|uniref:NERD domain-containing protein n=1 Tax=Neisseria weixii TaxID=1853276 RepID=UPI0013156205|nr:NERD domain-containing protein [Neisseria weixii]
MGENNTMESLIIFVIVVCFVCMLLVGKGSNQPSRRKKTRQNSNQKKQSNLNKEEKTALKGAIGEQIIKVQVLSKLDTARYRYFHNLIVPIDGGSTQIDNIVISPYGIFVIEAKYFQGWIFGAPNQPRWTHTLPSGSKFSFQNPLRQNYKHIKALSKLLGLSDKEFHSIVAFTHRNCQLKTTFPENVCLVSDFIPYVQKHDKEVFSIEQCTEFCRILSNPDFEATPERIEHHVQSLKQKETSAVHHVV